MTLHGSDPGSSVRVPKHNLTIRRGRSHTKTGKTGATGAIATESTTIIITITTIITIIIKVEATAMAASLGFTSTATSTLTGTFKLGDRTRGDSGAMTDKLRDARHLVPSEIATERPHPHGKVPGSRGQETAAGAKGDRGDTVPVTPKRGDNFRVTISAAAPNDDFLVGEAYKAPQRDAAAR